MQVDTEPTVKEEPAPPTLAMKTEAEDDEPPVEEEREAPAALDRCPPCPVHGAVGTEPEVAPQNDYNTCTLMSA